MQVTQFELSGNLRELTAQGTPLFPCAGYDEDFDKFATGDVPWHWHEEIELVVVYHGSTVVECGAASFVLGVNEGIFINSNVLHSLRVFGGAGCKIINLVFHPSLLSGAPQSIFEHKYVRPIVACRSIGGVALTPAVPWQREVLQAVARGYHLYEQQEFGYELLVREQLSVAWYCLALYLQEQVAQVLHGSNAEEARIKAMLTFVQEHHADTLNVAQIARAANVSESECYRCFKKMLGVSPLEYLLRHRTCVAAGLLSSTDKPVTEISSLVGFNSPSNFSKIFRQRLNCTPRAYRCQQRANP